MDAQYIDFYRKLNSSPCKFADVMSISNQARDLANRSGNAILHSEAISMILKDQQSDIIADDEVIDEFESKYIKEMFSYIDDKEVKDAVYDSFYDSKVRHNLLYVYNSISDESRKSRVRILTRMLWFNLVNTKSRSDSKMSETTKKRGRKRKNADIESIQIDETIITENAVIESETKSEYETPVIEEIPQDDPIDVVETADAPIKVSDTIETVVESNSVAIDNVAETPAIETEPVAEPEVKVETETVEAVVADVKEEVKPKKSAKAETKAKAEKEDSKISVGKKYTLPFARLYQTSVAKLPICVCSGEVEILSDEIHDGRINVLNHGTKLRGWINVTEIH